MSECINILNSMLVSYIDGILIVILFLSIVLGYFRGFISETLRVLVWIGAVLVTYFTYTHYHFCIPKIDPVVTIGLLFVGCLIIFKLLHLIIEKYTKNDLFSVVDKPLGMIFGAVRGLFILFSIVGVFNFKSKFMDIVYDNIRTYIDIHKYEKMVKEKGQVWVEKVLNYKKG